MNSDQSAPLTRLQHGFSLVEMLVALTVSLLLLAGLATLQTNSKRAYVETEQRGRLQENLRFGAEVMAKALRLSAYRGCRTEDSIPLPDPPVQGSDGGTGAADEITVRHIEVASLATYSSGNNFTLSPPHQLKVGDTLILQSCSLGLEAVQISAIDTDTPNVGTDTVTLNPAPCAAGGVNTGRDCAGATIHRYLNWRFHILNNTLALNGQEYVGDGTEDRIENLQFLYGEDTNGDNQANGYVTASNVTDWNNVVSVRLAMLLATKEFGSELDSNTYQLLDQLIDPVDDTRKRRISALTVQLRNRVKTF